MGNVPRHFVLVADRKHTMNARGINIVGTSASTRGAYGWPCFHCGKPKKQCSKKKPCCKKCNGGSASH